MSIKRRLEKLEQRVEAQSMCPHCRGKHLSIEIRGMDNLAGREPKPCPACGDVGQVMRLTFKVVEEVGNTTD